MPSLRYLAAPSYMRSQRQRKASQDRALLRSAVFGSGAEARLDLSTVAMLLPLRFYGAKGHLFNPNYGPTDYNK
jgi:hypothetical protein